MAVALHDFHSDIHRWRANRLGGSLFCCQYQHILFLRGIHAVCAGDNSSKGYRLTAWQQRLLIPAETYMLLKRSDHVSNVQLELTTGIMPSLSMATSLIAFGLLKAYTAVMTRLGWAHAQFTPQACLASTLAPHL